MITRTTIKEGQDNWSKLQAVVAAAEAASPKLRRDGTRFRAALSKRQARTFARIMANPNSREYKDYIESTI